MSIVGHAGFVMLESVQMVACAVPFFLTLGIVQISDIATGCFCFLFSRLRLRFSFAFNHCSMDLRPCRLDVCKAATVAELCVSFFLLRERISS